MKLKLDGMTITIEELATAMKLQAGRNKLKQAQASRSRRYGIKAQQGGALTIPARFARLGAKEGDFADPVNYRYPVWLTVGDRESLSSTQLGQVRNAPVRFSQFKENYDPASRGKVEARIQRALKKFKVGEFAVSKGDGSAFIALFLSSEVAQKVAMPGGEKPENLHVTLAFYPDVSILGDPSKLIEVVREWTANYPNITAKVNGMTRFLGSQDPERDPFVLSVDSNSLGNSRDILVDNIEARLNLVPAKDHGFNPHVTLAYIPKDSPTPDFKIKPFEWAFDSVSVIFGGEDGQRFDFPLGLDNPMEKAWECSIVKSDNERQIVYGVALRANAVDSQRDIVSLGEVERAAHRFMMNSRHGDLQHQEFLPAGEEFTIVESSIARIDEPPYVAKGDWVVAVKLGDRPWQMYKNGEINGFSIKGKGRRERVV